jgi:hypothetical protein
MVTANRQVPLPLLNPTKAFMSNKNIYHYVYRITNIVGKKHYYGVRTSKIHPSQDLGIKYFSSSKDNAFKQDQKDNPSHYKYKVVQIFSFRELAVQREVDLHNKFDVGNNVDIDGNKKFYNKTKQTSTGFDTTGMAAYKDGKGNVMMVLSKDKRVMNGELIHILSGIKHTKKSSLRETVTVKDVNNNYFRISIHDSRYLSGELVGVAKGLLPVRDRNNNFLQVSKTDSRYLSGELLAFSKGVSNIKCKNMVTVRNKFDECFNVSNEDPRYLSGELTAASKGVKRPNTPKRGKDKLTVCPHCGKEGGIRAMSRWHFENCKLINHLQTT